ncbi:MAG: DUF3445 domain-containing protein [Rhodospirillaceae bacterium]|nr:DUF3445 domain-containing protein [Rhodospirillaceae bacterium]
MNDTLHPARMGLEPLPLADWLAPQPGDRALLAERARLMAAYGGDVVAALPEADAAVAELADVLRDRGFPILPAPDSFIALGAIGQAVAEDICVLTPAPDHTFRLTAGLLCFPNRWKLREKLGGSVLAVHGPVPDYAAQLTANVDRFLARLKPERAYIRSNWGLAGAPDLFLPEPTPPVDPQGDAAMYLRREDQSFLKLPRTGTVIFAIRTHVQAWSETPERHRADILKSIRGLSPDWLAYKSIRREM